MPDNDGHDPKIYICQYFNLNSEAAAPGLALLSALKATYRKESLDNKKPFYIHFSLLGGSVVGSAGFAAHVPRRTLHVIRKVAGRVSRVKQGAWRPVNCRDEHCWEDREAWVPVAEPKPAETACFQCCWGCQID